MILYADTISSREELHQALQTGLSLPEWYGKNLDALWDCLTEFSQETEICILNADALYETLGSYAEVFRSVLMDAQEENHCIHVRWDGVL